MIPRIQPAEFALAQAYYKSALHLFSGIIKSASASQVMSPTGYLTSPAKVAAAADALNKLAGLLEELQAKHTETVKHSEALVAAVKLAQEGLLDVDDVIHHAGQAKEGSVSPIGRIENADDEVEQPTRSATENPLSDFLRNAR